MIERKLSVIWGLFDLKIITINPRDYGIFLNDDFVKSRKTPFFVIPAEAGIQSFQMVTDGLDSGFHRSDGFLRVH